MYVSNEVRRREIPESAPDPSAYASSTNGASFLAILSEVGRTKDDFSEQDAGRTHEVTPESPDHVDSAGGDTAVTEESNSETNAITTAESETSRTEETGSDATESPVAATALTTPVAVAVNVPLTPPAETEIQVDVATLPSASASADGLLADPHGLLTTPETAVLPAEPVAPVNTPSADSGAVESIEGVIDPALSPDVAIQLDVEAAPAAPVFPKNLNAVLAEGAVRPVPEGVGVETTTPASDNVVKLTEPTTEATTELPDHTPISHAAAMESGGVRPQTSALPRLPMANLPGELAQQMHLMQQEGARTMRLRLVPENLGELQIEIQGTGDAMKVRLISANPAVRDALESQMSDLKDAMQKQGLALDQATVDGEPNRRGLPQEQERRPATITYRESSTAPERPDAIIRRAAPTMPGSGALNVLA